MQYAIHKLARWIKAQAHSKLPEEVSQACIRAILDTVGVAFAGGDASQAIAAREFAEAEYGAGSAVVIGGAQRLTARGAAFANGVAAHTFDFDDTCYAGICHGSAVILPAILASAQHRECSGQELIQAFAIASEIAYALGSCLGDGVYYRGWFNTSLLGSIGAAAGVATILKLDDTATAAAMANTISHCGGSRSILGTNFKPVMAGQAAALGVECAHLAAAGLSAAPNALEHRFGLAALTGADTTDDQYGFKALGKPWRLIEPGLAVKRYPVCSAAQAAIEGVATIAQVNAINAESVVSIDCFVPKLVAISLPYRTPTTTAEAQFSLPFTVACALIHGDLTHRHLKGDNYQDDRIKKAINRVHMHALEDADPLAAKLQPEGVHIIVTTKNGERFQKMIPEAYGMPGRPFSDEALDKKFLACLRDCSPDGDQLLRELRNLAISPDVSNLMATSR
ncbi:MAG: MmgE/PrpD family protein [Pseudomonadota bacterium]